MANRTRYNADVIPAITALARQGMFKRDIAKQLGIHSNTLDAWISKHDELADAFNPACLVADAQVENAAFMNAIGFDYTEKKITKMRNARTNKVESIKEEIIHRKQLPSDKAIQYWLNNRQRDRWKSVYVRDAEDMPDMPQLQILATQIHNSFVGNEMVQFNKVDSLPSIEVLPSRVSSDDSIDESGLD